MPSGYDYHGCCLVCLQCLTDTKVTSLCACSADQGLPGVRARHAAGNLHYSQPNPNSESLNAGILKVRAHRHLSLSAHVSASGQPCAACLTLAVHLAWLLSPAVTCKWQESACRHGALHASISHCSAGLRCIIPRCLSQHCGWRVHLDMFMCPAGGGGRRRPGRAAPWPSPTLALAAPTCTAWCPGARARWQRRCLRRLLRRRLSLRRKLPSPPGWTQR